jgi:hypothetical protein
MSAAARERKMIEGKLHSYNFEGGVSSESFTPLEKAKPHGAAN